MFVETVGGFGVSSISESSVFTIVKIWATKVKSEAGQQCAKINCQNSK
jgi:hypothetical protein